MLENGNRSSMHIVVYRSQTFGGICLTKGKYDDEKIYFWYYYYIITINQ